MRAAVIDSGPLICLEHLGLAESLIQFFDLILVPSSVQREVSQKHRFRYRLKKLYASGRYRRCVSADKWNVQLLLADIEEGEAEAIVQAQENNAASFIGDDSRAREIAWNKGLKPVGTVALLARLHLEGFADHPKTLVAKLVRDKNFRVSAAVIDACLSEASQPL